MNDISIFLANNYIWFLYADVFMIFVLLIYILIYKLKHRTLKKEVLETIKINDDSVEQLDLNPEIVNTSLQESVETLETNSGEANSESQALTEIINNEPTFKA